MQRRVSNKQNKAAVAALPFGGESFLRVCVLLVFEKQGRNWNLSVVRCQSRPTGCASAGGLGVEIPLRLAAGVDSGTS